MTTTDRTTAATRVPMTSLRKTALVAGLMYVLTFVSIPTLALYGPVHAAGYITGPGPDTAVIVGGILEVIVALAGIGTAVALYPVVKRQNQGLALGFVGSRTLEAAAIFVGVASLLTVVALRQAGAGADAAVTGQALVAFYAALLVASDAGIMSGLWGQVSVVSAIAALPIAVWEFSLGYLIVKGFKPSPITAGPTAAGATPAHRDAVAV